MKPRETGGNLPGLKPKKQRDAAKATPAPSTYRRNPSEPGSFGSLVERVHAPKIKPKRGRLSVKDADALHKAYKPLRYASAPFPYTNPLQVAYANASGDVERNILPKAVKIPTKPPAVHPGLKPGDAGYAYRGRNDIWLTPEAYMRDPNFTRGVALHEFAHTRQSPARLPKWAIEGGADYVAKRLAKKIGLPSYRPGYPKYLKSVERRVRKKK